MTTDNQDQTEEKPASEETESEAGTTPRRTTRRRTTTKAASKPAEAKSTEAKPVRRRTRAKAVDAKADDAKADGAKAAAKPTRRRRRASELEEQPEEVKPALEIRPPPRVRAKLQDEVGPALMQEFAYTTPMQIPRLTKIVVNMGLGEALVNNRAIENAAGDLTLITGQRPVTTRARKSIAGFKIREGMAIGISVTLRGRRMYEFLDRLVSSALPRIRDFQGLSRDSFDGRGNYSLGLREQIIFPEIDYNSIDKIRGLQIAIVTTAPTDREGLRLLELLGMPFTRSRETAAVA